MDKWILFPHEIDFGSGNVYPLSFGASTPYKVENAVYSNGELLCYIQDGAVYDSSGNFVFSFGYDYAMLKEMAVVPLPGSCNTWCLFWLEAYPLTTLEFHFQEIKIVDGNILQGSNGLVSAGELFGSTGGIAVSQPVNYMGDRYVYLVHYQGIWKYRLQSNGLFLEETVSFAEGFEWIAEADLSPDGNLLAWGDENRVHVYDLQGEEYFTYSLGTPYSFVFGVEFSADNKYLYICHSEQGLLRWEFEAVGSMPKPVEGAKNFVNTHLERGKDGYIYAVRADGMLGAVDDLGVVLFPFELTVSSYPADPNWEKLFALPDQIDGEDYGSFLGVPLPVIERFDINGQTVWEYIDESHPPLLVYNCAPILLNDSISGPYSGYTIHVYQTDPTNGQQISGPGFLDTSFHFFDTLSPSIDIRCLADPTNCDLFDDYINPPYNTFAVVLQLEGRCGSVQSTGQIEVQDAPAPADIGLEINDTQTGVPCPAAHDVAQACKAGIYSASINLANSNGDITFYQLAIDEVSCENGSSLANVYTGAPVSVSGVSGLTAIALNALEINDTTGYFADPSWLGRCLKIYATVGNDCGYSTDFSFLKFDGTYIETPVPDDRADLRPHPTRPDKRKDRLLVYPNPCTDKLHVTFYPEVPGSTVVRLLSIHNQQLELQTVQSRSDVLHFVFEDLHLAPGMYVVICHNGGRKWTEKVIVR